MENIMNIKDMVLYLKIYIYRPRINILVYKISISSLIDLKLVE